MTPRQSFTISVANLRSVVQAIASESECPASLIWALFSEAVEEEIRLAAEDTQLIARTIPLLLLVRDQLSKSL
jgi:hypothetical protein